MSSRSNFLGEPAILFAGTDIPDRIVLHGALVIIFIVLTAICSVALWIAGMSPLESTIHAMTTIATGGFSTSDASVGHFNSWVIDLIITIGMIVGSLPFLLYLQAIRGKPWLVWRDE